MDSDNPLKAYQPPQAEQLPPPAPAPIDGKLRAQIISAAVLIGLTAIGTTAHYMLVMTIGGLMALAGTTRMVPVAADVVSGQLLFVVPAAICAIGVFLHWRWSFTAAVWVSSALAVNQVAGTLIELTGVFVSSNKFEAMLLLLVPMGAMALFTTITARTCWRTRSAWRRWNQLEAARLMQLDTAARADLMDA